MGLNNLTTIEQFISLKQKNAIPHAIILHNSLSLPITGLLQSISKILLCKNGNPCEQCQSCQLINTNTHPDLISVVGEKEQSPIKIEQVRSLQTDIFNTAQFSFAKVIIINSADRMTIGAVNALLKILEEPPANTYFLLTALRAHFIKPTVISRCQQWQITKSCVDNNFIEKKEIYLREEVLQQLTTVCNKQSSIHAIAATWKDLAYLELIDTLYYLHSLMIRSFFNPQTKVEQNLAILAKTIKPLKLFKQIDKLNTIKKNSKQNLQVNQLLVFENFLLGYL